MLKTWSSGNLYTYTSYTIIKHIFRNITCNYRKTNPKKTIITTDLLTGVEVSRLSNIKTFFRDDTFEKF